MLGFLPSRTQPAGISRGDSAGIRKGTGHTTGPRTRASGQLPSTTGSQAFAGFLPLAGRSPFSTTCEERDLGWQVSSPDQEAMQHDGRGVSFSLCRHQLSEVPEDKTNRIDNDELSCSGILKDEKM